MQWAPLPESCRPLLERPEALEGRRLKPDVDAALSSGAEADVFPGLGGVPSQDREDTRRSKIGRAAAKQGGWAVRQLSATDAVVVGGRREQGRRAGSRERRPVGHPLPYISDHVECAHIRQT